NRGKVDRDLVDRRTWRVGAFRRRHRRGDPRRARRHRWLGVPVATDGAVTRDVGMIAARQPAARLTNGFGAGIARQAEDVQIVAHGSFAYDSTAADMKECPMCGELMRLVTRERTELIPGTRQTVKRDVKEW